MTPTPRSFAGSVVSRALDAAGGSSLHQYRELIDLAFASVQPAYATQSFGDLFRRRGRDATWVASLLASDSYTEGYSATRLWQYASSLPDKSMELALMRHAKDEAKHSKLFATAVLKTFPQLGGPSLRSSLESNTPNLDQVDVRDLLLNPPSQDELLSSMLLINLYEVKALFLCMMTKPVALAHAPAENTSGLGKLFDSIAQDEGHHIRYTAAYLEEACNQGHRQVVESMLREFQESINQVTHNDLEADAVNAPSLEELGHG